MLQPDWADDPHGSLGLTKVINAAGSYTPLGVSRSSKAVAAATGAALPHWFVIDELQVLVGRRLASFAGAEAAAVTHCAAAGITLCVAAALAGSDPERVQRLPDASDLPHGVVLPAGHAVNYGHPITQDIRLAGGRPILAGTEDGCPIEALDSALSTGGVAALLLVSSRLTRGAPVDLSAAVAVAHQHGVAAIIDAAAQDWRVRDLVATRCDALVVSGHKYMASPTAGVVFGSAAFIRAFRAQEHGIGRAMKASKEALLGVLAALEERERQDKTQWQANAREQASRVASQLRGLAGLTVEVIPDPVGMPFDRVRIGVDPKAVGFDAQALAARLASGNPSVRVMEHELLSGFIVLELVGLEPADEQALVRALHEASVAH